MNFVDAVKNVHGCMVALGSVVALVTIRMSRATSSSPVSTLMTSWPRK